MKGPSMRKILKTAGVAIALLLGLLLLGGGLFAIDVFSRKPLQTVHATTHATIARKACLDCHAPIAEEWRQSYHYETITIT